MELTKKLILMQGIPASGKTTWSKNWVAEDPKTRIRFNNDDIRNMLGVYWVPSREPLVKSIKLNIIEKAMENFSMKECKKANIYPDIWNYEEETDEIKEKLMDYFQNLKDFYKKILEVNGNVMVTIC